MPRNKPARAATSEGATAPAPKKLRRTFVMSVRVGLQPQDREPLVSEQQQKLKDFTELGAEASEVASGYRRKRKDLWKQIEELSLKLTQGIPEDTEVEEIKDFSKNTVTIVRTDTRAVIEKREMTDDDRQLHLGGKEDDPEAEEQAAGN